MAGRYVGRRWDGSVVVGEVGGYEEHDMALRGYHHHEHLESNSGPPSAIAPRGLCIVRIRKI
jgi:hypothetical protein